MPSSDVLVYFADSLIGTWLVRELMRQQGPNSSEETQPASIYAVVYSSRNKRSHELFTLGAQVIEFSSSNKSYIEEVTKKVKGVVMIPPLENKPFWDKEVEEAIECLSKVNPQVVLYLSSVYGSHSSSSYFSKSPLLIPTHYEKGNEILSKLQKVEKRFEEVGQNKKWSVLRTTFMQEFLLHYSRMIQETGSLMLPIGNSKCSYLSLSDVGSCIWKLIDNPSSFNIYTLTGPETISGNDITQKISESIQNKVSYQDIDIPYARRYLRYELGDYAMALVDYYLVMMCLVKDEKLDFATDDVKKITKNEPTKVESLFRDYSQLFRP